MDLPTIITLAVISLALIGMGYLINLLINKLNAYRKPKSPIRIDKKKMEKLHKLLWDMTLEEKLIVIRLVLGNCRIHLKLEEGSTTIELCGSIPEEYLSDRPTYTG